VKTKIYTIKNEEGLHARPASDFCEKAGLCKSSVAIIKDGDQYDGKSMLSVLSMGVAQGDTIKLVIDGPDEDQTLAELIEVLDNA
jgi:phosphotransferase system HPr (HPr) family protein